MHSNYITNTLAILSQSFCMVRLSKMYPLRKATGHSERLKLALVPCILALMAVDALENIVIFKAKLALPFSFLNSRSAL